jgi:protein-arginine deiminase
MRIRSILQPSIFVTLFVLTACGGADEETNNTTSPTGAGGSGTSGTGGSGGTTIAAGGQAGTSTSGTSGTGGSGTAGTSTSGSSGSSGSGTSGTAGSGTAGTGTSGTGGSGTAGSGTAGTGTSGTGGSGTAGTGTSGTGGSGTSGTGGSGGNPNAPIVDLRADTNRNGTVDLNDPSEDANENTWDTNHGAIFIANIDDDQESCSKSGSDAALAACNDAADNIVNGNDDLLDMAPMKTVAWPTAPDGVVGTLSVGASGKPFVRIFKKSGNNIAEFNPDTGTLTAAEIRNGVDFYLEGKDIMRDTAVWDGYVDVTFAIKMGNADVAAPDVVRLRIAPVLTPTHLMTADRIYAYSSNSASSVAFRTDLQTAMTGAGLATPLQGLTNVSDQWTQDYFEPAYTTMPGPGGNPHVVHINYRSANFTNNQLRAAGKVVFNTLRGKDTGGAVAYDPNHPNYMDSLNSFGNFETIPPYSYNGKSYPNGRVIRGSVPNFYPDPVFQKMIDSQGAQPTVKIDTAWLLVGHVDETISFIKANNARGWTMMANDAKMAIDMLNSLSMDGYGGSQMFVGKQAYGGGSAMATVNQVLANSDVMAATQEAIVEVDGQLEVIKAATGIADSEIVRIPFTHEHVSGYSLAYQPGTVNGIMITPGHFASPRPHGPKIPLQGGDPFEKAVENALAPYNITVHWVEDWDLYHRLSGEVHCGSNARRVVPNTMKWWENPILSGD